MYDDSPDWRVFFNLLEGIYHENPVRIDIAGTQESIAQINADLLYRCYYTFYNLHNMVLAIAGDVDEDEILSVCDELLKPCENKNLISVVPEEPDRVKDSYREQRFEVAVPMFNLGYKSKPVSNEEIVRETVLCNLAEELLIGETSELYKKLYDEGTINSTFYFETFSGDGYFVPVFGGESRDPERVRSMLAEEIAMRREKGFDTESFEIAKRQYYGSLIKALENPESAASNLINAGLRGTGDAFSVTEAVAAASDEDVKLCLKTRFDTDNSTLSVIRPIEK
jgi:predicted Zn-dependent peptidase